MAKSGSGGRGSGGKEGPTSKGKITEPAIVVDRRGLASKLASRPRAFILYELLQNAWDENVSNVFVTVKPVRGKAQCRITVEDDCPEGFADLASVYTLFKQSKKGSDSTKRGRFEMGEKLVIASALSAKVTSTKGTIIFKGDRRSTSRARRAAGTVFTGVFPMTRDQYAELVACARMLIPPAGIETRFDGELLPARRILHSFKAILPTVQTDAEGNLARTHRMTVVKVYEVREGESAHVYEMGIPVVETGDRWHYDVQQRVPVDWERSNVPPAFLTTLRVEVVNAMHTRLTMHDATAGWVSEAIADSRCGPEAITTVVRRRFGEKAVIDDPSDPEGTKIAVSKGYTVIPWGAFSRGAWQNIRSAGAVRPAGMVTPSPKPTTTNVIPESEWTADMVRIANFSKRLCFKLTDEKCDVTISRDPHANYLASFGLGMPCRLTLNYGRLGMRWFGLRKRSLEILDLLLHEFSHYKVSDHLSHEMHETATLLGARLAGLALDDPDFFKG